MSFDEAESHSGNGARRMCLRIRFCRLAASRRSAAHSFPFTDAVIPPLTGTPKNPITNKEYLNQFSEGKLSACCLPAGLNLNAVDVLPFKRGPKHFSGVLDRSHSGHRDNRPPPRQDRAAF
jgi:hypothetical protein